MRLLIVFLVVSLLGCLKPETTGSVDDKGLPKVEDNGRLAGATSSTNWPPEDGGILRSQAEGITDSNLTIKFTYPIGKIKLSGNLFLYKLGPIPGLDSVPLLRIPFNNTDSVFVSSGEISRFLSGDSDLADFSLQVQSDSGECFFFGFEFSQKSLTFTRSPFSVLSSSSSPLYPVRSFVTAVIDSNMESLGSTIGGKPALCFYIPGSPFYWKYGVDSAISLGPLPKGNYPVRYLRISQPDSVPGFDRLEAFETKFIEIGGDPESGRPRFRIQIGEKVASVDFKGSIVLHTSGP